MTPSKATTTEGRDLILKRVFNASPEKFSAPGLTPRS